MKSNNVTFTKMYFLRGDALPYIAFCENFYQSGQHFISWYGYTDFTYRMPNFIFIYYPLRLLFSQQMTLNGIIIFQVFLSAVSNYFLARVAFFVFKKEVFFYSTFFIYCLSSFVPAWNSFLYTESIGTSLLIISVYLLFVGKRERSVKLLFLSGLLMAICIFFRAFLGAIWAGSLLYLLLSPETISQRLKLLIAYACFFILIESLWVGRNYQKTGELVAFDTSHFWYDRISYKAERSFINFLKAYGFDLIDWEKNYPCTWFLTDQEAADKHTIRPGDDVFPQRTFYPDFNIDSLKYARSCLIYVRSNADTASEKRKYYDKEACRMFNKFTLSARTIRPWDYYILNRLKATFKLVNQYKGCALKSMKYPFNVVFVFTDYFINYFVIVGGIAGAFIMLFSNWRNRELYFIIFIPAFIIFFFGLVMMEVEPRYLTTAYPFLLVICVAASFKLVEKKWMASLILFSLMVFVLTALTITKEIKF